MIGVGLVALCAVRLRVA